MKALWCIENLEKHPVISVQFSVAMNVMASFKSTFCLADFRFLLAKKLDFRKIQLFT